MSTREMLMRMAASPTSMLTWENSRRLPHTMIRTSTRCRRMARLCEATFLQCPRERHGKIRSRSIPDCSWPGPAQV